MRILMVCLGNICRSPMAEGVLKHKVKQMGLNWVVDSAGTESYHVGEKPHLFSINTCAQHGIDISSQRARKFVAEDFDGYDKIYAMAHDVYREIKLISGRLTDLNKLDYFLNEQFIGQNRSVPDPYMLPEQEYERVYRLIDSTCDLIIERYK